MRVLASVALLAGLLAGCVGHYASEHIEARYHDCLNNFRPLAGVKAVDHDAVCSMVRDRDYDYRLSARRFIPIFPSSPSGSCASCPQRVIVVPGY